MKEMTFERTEDSGRRDAFGPGYRVIKPCLRRPAEVFVVEDLAGGGRRRLVRLAPDRPEVRAAADQARRVVHNRLAGLVRAESGPRGDLLLVGDAIEGETLAERLERLGPLPESWIVEVMGGVARGLDQAHAMGVSHGDLRPEWVMIDEAGAASVLGLAVEAAIRDVDAGPSAWMAPEIAAGGDPAPQADVYAFAAIVFACLNGRPPSLRGESDDVDALRGDDADLADPIARRALRRAALRGLDRDPSRRPSTCGDLMTLVEAAIRDADASDVAPAAPAPAEGPDRVRVEYATPLDLLDLESAVADIVPRKARLVLKEHPAIRVRWEKGEHFLSSGAVYKQLQQWQAAGEALERARVEFDAALTLDRGLVASRDRHEQLQSRLDGFRWAEHPALCEMRDRVRAIVDGDRNAWWLAWDEGRLGEADDRLDAADAILHEARFLNREIASAAEWRDRWADVGARIPDRVLDQRWAEEIRDHRAACRRAAEALEQGRFAIAGGVWSTRIDRLAVILDREAAAWDAAMSARRRFDEAMSRAPKSRPISRPLREALDRLLAASDRIEKDLLGAGRFEEAERQWSDAAASIGGLVQQDIERYGRVETARENHGKLDSSGRPKRPTWSRLKDEMAAIAALAAAASTAREAGDFDAAIEGWTQARERLERALAADLERHREALLACERLDRRFGMLPPRALDRSVRADIDRLRGRRNVLDDWMASGRFTEIEDAVRRAIETIDKALEIDGRRHDAAVTARDRAVAVNVEFPDNVPQPVLDLLKPLFGEIDSTAVQARQAFELGEYADCAEAWERTIALKNRATDELRAETERFERRRRRRALVRTASAIAAVIVVLLAGAEFGARAWFGSLRTRVVAISIPARSTGLLARQAELLASLDGVLAGPSVGVNVLTGGLDLLDRPASLAAENERSLALQNRLAGVRQVEVAGDAPAWLKAEIEGFNETRVDIETMLADGSLDGLDERITTLGAAAEGLQVRVERAGTLQNGLASLNDRRPAESSGFDAVDQGWNDFDDLVATAQTQFADAELDETEETIGKAEAKAESLDTDRLRLTAEQARDALHSVWFADDAAVFRMAAGDSDRSRIEAHDRDATASYEAEDFGEAAEKWTQAMAAAEDVRSRVAPDFGAFKEAEVAWSHRAPVDDRVLTLAGFEPSWNRAIERSREAADLGDQGRFQQGADGYHDALEQWKRTDARFKEAFKDRLSIVGDDDRPPADRRKAIDWLLDVMDPADAEFARLKTIRDRLVWRMEVPVRGARRVLPLDDGRSIEFVYVERTTRMLVPPGRAVADGAVTVEVTGFWISAEPVSSEAFDGGPGGEVLEATHREASRKATNLDGVDGPPIVPGSAPERWHCRLPTESEWLRARAVDAIPDRIGHGEWVADRFVDEDWWQELVSTDPAGSMFGDRNVVRRDDLRTGGGDGDRHRFRVVLSPVERPRFISPEQRDERRDPRLAGKTEPGRETRKVDIEGVEVEFVLLPVGPRRDPLWVATTETTQGLWKAVMGSVPGGQRVRDDARPVANMTLYEARKFCRQIRKDSNIKASLPTHESWLLAAQAEREAPYCFGDEARADSLAGFAWSSMSDFAAPNVVGQLKPNWWFLRDIHGNVEEWTDPGDDAPLQVHVMGGHVESPADGCRLDRPIMVAPTFKSDLRGFRLVAEELPEPK